MDQNIKQQIVESINGTTNVLVTVSSNPTVDELAACIGLTLVLNKLGKHATAVYSGKTPSTLEFLKPDDTLEDNTDSLRDFIIALDKSKADKLRYKVEDEVVKIFITPYKTSIGQKDLEFSQGDFNVDVVMAIGVHKREELDKAIVAHGRILHDATVVCLNNDQVSNIGVYNWQDAEASSLCEMVVDLAETIQPDNFDAQTATALLTGIVAETARFSNEKTSPRTMSLAAKLMAAGANQQLVASKLQTTLTKTQVGLKEEPEEPEEEENEEDSGTLKISHKPEGGDDKSSASGPKPATEPEDNDSDGSLSEEPLEEPLAPKTEKRLESTPPAPELPQPEVAQPVPTEPAQAEPPITDVKGEDGVVHRPSAQIQTQMKPSGSRLTYEPPVMGGTLTASSQADVPEPTTDGLSMNTAPNANAPILSHSAPQVDSNKPIIDEELVAHIEKTVGSPHAEQEEEEQAPPSQDLDALSEAAKAAASADTDENHLEPLAATGSQPFDMNVQDNTGTPLPTPTPSLAPQAPQPAPSPLPMSTPAAAPSASDVMGSLSQTPPSVSVPPADLNSTLPPQVVPADPGLPPEQTASSAPQPLAPPPVPPPLMPGTLPAPGQQPPLPPIPPAPGQ